MAFLSKITFFGKIEIVGEIRRGRPPPRSVFVKNRQKSTKNGVEMLEIPVYFLKKVEKIVFSILGQNGGGQFLTIFGDPPKPTFLGVGTFFKKSTIFLTFLVIFSKKWEIPESSTCQKNDDFLLKKGVVYTRTHQFSAG